MNAVITMRQRGITFRQVGGEFGLTGTDPTVKVRSDLSADPLVPGVVGTSGQVEARLSAVHEFVGHLAQQGLVRCPFRRPGGASRQQPDPGARDVFDCQCAAVVLQHQQREHRVIDVVIRFCAPDMTAAAWLAVAFNQCTCAKRDIVA